MGERSEGRDMRLGTHYAGSTQTSKCRTQLLETSVKESSERSNADVVPGSHLRKERRTDGSESIAATGRQLILNCFCKIFFDFETKKLINFTSICRITSFSVMPNV